MMWTAKLRKIWEWEEDKVTLLSSGSSRTCFWTAHRHTGVWGESSYLVLQPHSVLKPSCPDYPFHAPWLNPGQHSPHSFILLTQLASLSALLPIILQLKKQCSLRLLHQASPSPTVRASTGSDYCSKSRHPPSAGKLGSEPLTPGLWILASMPLSQQERVPCRPHTQDCTSKTG